MLKYKVEIPTVTRVYSKLKEDRRNAAMLQCCNAATL